jgi:hypothetical protein
LPNVKPPDQVQLIEGEIADYWFDPTGILYSYSKNPKRTVENIRNNIALVKKITGNKKVPLLIYLSNSPVPDKETRKFSAEQLPMFIKPWPWYPNPAFKIYHEYFVQFKAASYSNEIIFRR